MHTTHNTTLHTTLHTLHHTAHSTPHCTLHTAHCTLNRQYWRQHTMHGTLHAVYCTLHITVDRYFITNPVSPGPFLTTHGHTLYTAHYTLHTIHSTPPMDKHCTLHTIHSTPPMAGHCTKTAPAQGTDLSVQHAQLLKRLLLCLVQNRTKTWNPLKLLKAWLDLFLQDLVFLNLDACGIIKHALSEVSYNKPTSRLSLPGPFKCIINQLLANRLTRKPQGLRTDGRNQVSNSVPICKTAH